MRIHTIMCTYLGDLELDIGKTARWAQWFTDSIFFYDASGQDARKFAIDYSKTWPECRYAYHRGTPYQVDPKVMRQMAFQAADAAWKYDADDWVIYVDGTEGLSVDFPQDSLEWLSPDNMRYRYLYDEAAAATGDFLHLAVRIFISQGTVVEHTYEIEPGTGITAVWWENSPQYVGPNMTTPWGSLVRMIKVSALRTWTLAQFGPLDDYAQPAGSPLADHPAIVSYAYARYSEKDYHDPSLWTEENDEGFASRLFMQAVPGRNVPELPVVYSTPDPPGAVIDIPPGPARIFVDYGPNPQTFSFTGHVTKESGNETYDWHFGDGITVTATNPILHTFPASGPYTVVVDVTDPDVGAVRHAQVKIAPQTLDPITEQDPTPPPALPYRVLSPPYCFYVNQAAGDYVMAFAGLWRMNPRDGVWWDQMVIGPTPLDPVSGDTSVDPGQWGNQQPQPRAVTTRPDETGPGVDPSTL